MNLILSANLKYLQYIKRTCTYINNRNYFTRVNYNIYLKINKLN